MAICNITVENDADFHRTFQYKTTDEVPINITGGTFEMMLRRHAEDATAVLRLGSDTGEIQLVEPVNGKFAILIVQAELEKLATGGYEQSLIMTKDGRKTRIWSGSFTNNPGATR